MAPLLPRQQMLHDFDLLRAVEESGGVRELTALSVRADAWLDFRGVIHLPGGAIHPERGFDLGVTPDDREAWLLPKGRVLLVPFGPGGAVEELQLADARLDLREATRRLRGAILNRYRGGVELGAEPPAALPAVLNDLISLAWEGDPSTREAIYAKVAAAVDDSEAWQRAAARLKAAFERGLNDRSSEVRRISCRGLVSMAVGDGPRPPTGDPARILSVLFAVPEPDVHEEALRALLELPTERLSELAEKVEPLVRGQLTDKTADVRRTAAELEVRLAGDDLTGLARELESSSADRRLGALRALSRRPDRAAALLPALLEGLADPQEEIREAAADALEPALRDDPQARRRTLLAILQDVRSSPAAVLPLLTPETLADDEIRQRFVDAVGDMGTQIDAAVVLLADYYDDAAAVVAEAGLTALLHHKRPEVRLAALHRLADAPPGRQAVREEMLQATVELLTHADPRLRVAAARTIVAMGYAKAGDIVAALAYDVDAGVRHEVLVLLSPGRDPKAVQRISAAVRDVDRLFGLAAGGTGDDRMSWLAALDRLGEDESPQIPRVLGAVLGGIPPDTSDPFLRQAIDALDGQILERAGGGEDLLAVCRRLLEQSNGGREHAARIAGAVAHRDPAAVDFLWTLWVHSGGAGSEAARRALADLADRSLDPAVVDALRDLLDKTQDPSRRDVLRTLLAAG